MTPPPAIRSSTTRPVTFQDITFDRLRYTDSATLLSALAVGVNHHDFGRVYPRALPSAEHLLRTRSAKYPYLEPLDALEPHIGPGVCILMLEGESSSDLVLVSGNPEEKDAIYLLYHEGLDHYEALIPKKASASDAAPSASTGSLEDGGRPKEDNSPAPEAKDLRQPSTPNIYKYSRNMGK